LPPETFINLEILSKLYSVFETSLSSLVFSDD